MGVRADVDYGQIVKVYEGEPGETAARRYSPGWVVEVQPGNDHRDTRHGKISTSYVEQ